MASAGKRYQIKAAEKMVVVEEVHDQTINHSR